MGLPNQLPSSKWTQTQDCSDLTGTKDKSGDSEPGQATVNGAGAGGGNGGGVRTPDLATAGGGWEGGGRGR